MTIRNPPKEREQHKFALDRQRNIKQLALLLQVAEHEFARRHLALLREFGITSTADREADYAQDESGREPCNEYDRNRMNNEARLQLSLNRARAQRSMHDLARGIQG